jgi:hypothetical protein
LRGPGPSEERTSGIGPSVNLAGVIGYEPRIGLAEGMALTEQWLREEGRL